jgi:hypothetical protein
VANRLWLGWFLSCIGFLLYSHLSHACKHWPDNRVHGAYLDLILAALCIEKTCPLPNVDPIRQPLVKALDASLVKTASLSCS